MAKTSGGVRKGSKASAPRIVGFKETEKAIQVEIRWAGRNDGFWRGGVSRETGGTEKVWIPKNQIEEGRISEWISRQKITDIEIRKGADGVSAAFFDAKGKRIKVGTRRDAQSAKIREANRQNALSAANARRESLVEQAKRNGYRAHMRMKTRTLEQMAAGTYGRRKTT